MVNGSKPVIVTPDNQGRFQSFILFEPASLRMTEFDILVRGSQVKTMHEFVMDRLMEEDTLKAQILRNKLAKIGQMLDLLTNFDTVVISKFFDRIWRRYSYVSNIGEHFLDLPTFLLYFPEYKEQVPSLLAQRLDEEDEEDMDAQDSDTTPAPEEKGEEE